MTGLVSRRPVVGIVAGLLFGSLGMLLLGIEGEQGLAAVLFVLSAWFFVAIGVLSLSVGLYVLVIHFRKGQEP